MPLDVQPNPNFAYYYGTIDFEFWLRKYVGEDMVKWLKKNVHPLDLVYKLAEDHAIVLLNGGGFDAPNWSVRVSFANLSDDTYDDIGRAVRAVARGYVEFLSGTGWKSRRDQARPLTGHKTEDCMIDWFVAQLREHPELAFFVTITLGYAIGRLRIGSFTLGAVTGVLLAGVLVGQLGITLPGAIKQIFFLLFLFSIGYRTGPQFFQGLKKDGLAQAALSAIFSASGSVLHMRRRGSWAMMRAPQSVCSQVPSRSPRRSAQGRKPYRT